MDHSMYSMSRQRREGGQHVYNTADSVQLVTDTEVFSCLDRMRQQVCTDTAGHAKRPKAAPAAHSGCVSDAMMHVGLAH